MLNRNRQFDGLIGIRVDATREIGSGHAMRCMTVASALKKLNHCSVFFVSCEDSAQFVAERGFDVEVLKSSVNALNRHDAEALRLRCDQLAIRNLLVDTYSVDSGFFDAFSSGIMRGIKTTYIDGMYSNVLGSLSVPIRRPVDTVVNPNFFANEEDYKAVYEGTNTSLFLGPKYAMLRDEFADSIPVAVDAVSGVLITTGASNPDHMLERLTSICLELTRGSHITVHVVVGPLADYDGPTENVVLHRGEKMSRVMSICQVAVSAAGTTCIELAALGVPTLALEMVPNQRNDVAYYIESGMGLGCAASDEDDVIAMRLESLVKDSKLRKRVQQKCLSKVDGRGATRVAEAVLGMVGL